MVTLNLLARCWSRCGPAEAAGIRVTRGAVESLEKESSFSGSVGATASCLLQGYHLSDYTDVVQGSGSVVTPAGGRRARLRHPRRVSLFV